VPRSALFLLDPDIAYLNHGSFGACPRPVFDIYQEWQSVLEREPIDLLERRLEGARPRSSRPRRVRRSGSRRPRAPAQRDLGAEHRPSPTSPSPDDRALYRGTSNDLSPVCVGHDDRPLPRSTTPIQAASPPRRDHSLRDGVRLDRRGHREHVRRSARAPCRRSGVDGNAVPAVGWKRVAELEGVALRRPIEY
jgi:hypothetical protein